MEQYEPAWQVHLNGNFSVMMTEGKQVNAFHRLMQRLFFGFKWERL